MTAGYNIASAFVECLAFLCSGCSCFRSSFSIRQTGHAPHRKKRAEPEGSQGSGGDKVFREIVGKGIPIVGEGMSIGGGGCRIGRGRTVGGGSGVSLGGTDVRVGLRRLEL